MNISSFRDLEVWKGAMDLAADVYRISRDFPADERFGLTAQIRQAACSVGSNIAEGHARNGTREFLQFLSVALGSLAEVETQCEIAVRTGMGRATELTAAITDIGRLRGQLLTLRLSLKRRLHAIGEPEPEYRAHESTTPAHSEHEVGPLPPAPCPFFESPDGGAK